MQLHIRMALFLAETGWTAAVGGLLTWGAIAVLARASPLRLGSCKLSVGGAGLIRSLTSAVRLPRGAGREKRRISAAGMPTISTSGIWMRQRSGHPSPQPAAGKTSEEGAVLLEDLSADTALACLELLTVQCRASDTRLAAESVGSGTATTMLAGLAAKSAEARANTSDPASAKALAQGDAAARSTSRDVGGSRRGAQGKAPGAAALEQDWPNKRSMEHGEKIRAARVLLQLYVHKKDDVGGRSVLKLLNTMLILRIFALEVLTELAETIRRRLVRVLPPDGLVAVVGAYCFFFTTPQHGGRAVSVSNRARRLDRLPAPVQDLLVDALTEIWVRAGIERYGGGARDARGAVCLHFGVNSTRPINKRSEELLNACVLQPNAADEGRAVSAGGKHMEQLAVSQPVVNHAKSSPVEARGFHFAAAHEGNSLSPAGAVSCAWALTRLTFSRKSILLENLKEYLKRELFVVAKTRLNGTQTSLVDGVIAWKEEMIRLQEWGATAAALLHLRGDQSPCVAVTVRKEMVEALRNLRVALLQKRYTPVPNRHQIAPAGASLVHKHMQPFSSQARALIMEGLYFDAFLRERLQQAARSDSSRWLTRTEQSECLASAGHREENLTTIRGEDAATICGAVTWMLRLSAITQAATVAQGTAFFWNVCALFVAATVLQQDNAPILEALQMLHSEDPFMFSLPKTDLCYFLAAAHEGAVADLHMVSEQTLVASPERRMTLESARGYPSHSNPETKHSNEHENTTRNAEQQHTLCDVGEVHAFVSFEEKLKKFSSDLCRTVVGRISDFGQRELMRAISAVKRLDSDARELPFSGVSWLQHPDFSRVLDCLMRALWRRRQKDAKPLETHAPHIGYSVTDDILCAWHARGQQRPGNVDESSDADSKQGDRPIATELKGVVLGENVVQGRDDSSDAIRGRGQRQNIHKYSSNLSAAKEESPSSEALPTGMQRDPPVAASHSVERGRGSGTENCHICLPAYYAADAEDTSMLQLVCHVLRPCYSEYTVNKTDLSFPLSSTRERSFLLEKNEKRNISKPRSNRTFSEWNCSASLRIAKRVKDTIRRTAQAHNTGMSAVQNWSGERLNNEHTIKRLANKTDRA